jgi:hypothetical protein
LVVLESLEQDGDDAEVDHCFAGVGISFIVQCISAATSDTTKGAFENPSFWKDDHANGTDRNVPFSSFYLCPWVVAAFIAANLCCFDRLRFN